MLMHSHATWLLTKRPWLSAWPKSPRFADPDDGVEFLSETVSTSVIRDDEQYSGVRVTMTAQLATARVKLRLDVNFGDPVIPLPRTVELPSLRPDNPTI